MKEKLKKLINDSLKKLDISFQKEVIIEIPSNRENGDFSTNIAMQLTKIVGENPETIAKKIIAEINDEEIINIEIKKPGFINFCVKKDYLIKNINKVIELNEEYGKSNIGNGKNVNIEFVSANPTGILHLGNARGGAYGDSLARILKFTGHKVTKEYYVNDAGNQINNLGLSIKARYLEILNKPFEMPEDGYYGEEIINIAKKLFENFKDTLIEKEIEYFSDYGVTILIEKIKKVLYEYGIEYDVFTSEKAIRSKGNIPKIIEKLIDSGYTYEKEGALWFKATEFGDTKDHVLVKNDGSYTYLVPDIEYHIDKLNRNYTKLIDVFGTDHHGYVPRLKGAIQALGYDSNILDVKLLQLVRLIKDGEEVRMSKRTGNIVSLEELIDEVGVNATRYMFTSRSLDTQMDFDLELAKSKTNENPVYYVSYAYARICTILKSNNHNKNIEEYETLNNESAHAILEKVHNFEDVVKTAAIKELPHLITNYVYELATAFHTFYSSYRIITDNEKETAENLNLIKAAGITIKNALNLIGVTPPEQM